MTYVDTPEKWRKLAKYLETVEVFGWDTEFEGVDFGKGQSCVNRAKLDLWSVAVYDGGYSPRGFNTAKGYVLPPESLPYFKCVLENPAILKPAHNSNVDCHCMYNAGVDVQGVINTLTLYRWIAPGKFLYGIDVLGEEYLGKGKTEGFSDIFEEDVIGTVTKLVDVKVCSCGVAGCRKRKGHEKSVEVGYEYTEKVIGTRIIPLHEVRPGHHLWTRYVDYAARDAVLALELYDYASTLDWNTEVVWYKEINASSRD